MAWVDGDRSGLPPEVQVVLSTASGNPQILHAALQANGALREGSHFDWSLLLLVAEWEMATPVLYTQLRSLMRSGLPIPAPPLDEVREGPPSSALEVLERLAMIHEFRLREFEERFERLLRTFEADETNALILKGGALALGYYDSMRERPMSDVDIVVREPDVARVRERANALGWQRWGGPVPDAAYDTHHHLRPMEDDVGLGMKLELHGDVFPEFNPFLYSAADLWSGAEPVGTSGGRPLWGGIVIPSPQDLLLHNALHFTWSHSLAHGAWKALRDTQVLVASGRIDWGRFVDRARRSRGGTGAFWLLTLARDWAGIAVPSSVVTELDPGIAAPVKRVLMRHFGRGVGPGEPSPAVLTRKLWELAMRPGSSGHGSIRPWSEADKWLPEESSDNGAAPSPTATDPEGTGEEASIADARPDSTVRKGVRAARYMAGLLSGS